MLIIGVSFASAGFDDSNIKYKRVQYYLVYGDAEKTKADLLIVDSERERTKYQYKNADPPKRISLTENKINEHYISGYLTFTDDRDAQAYYDKIIPLIKAEDLKYGVIYMLENNHHSSNPEPDIIIQKIEYGDANEILLSP